MATPQDYCDQILKSVHSSSLHFLVQESSFPLYITLRKKFATHPQVKLHDSKDAKDDSTNELKLARDTINILEEKLAHTEREFVNESNKLKSKREEFLEEVKILRESLTKSQNEASDKNKVISELKKSIKAKDKEIYNIEKNVNIATDTNKQLRDKITELKRDQSAAAKTLKNAVKQGSIEKEKIEQKVKSLEKKVKSVESNNNNTANHEHSSSSASAATTSSVLHTSTFPTPPSMASNKCLPTLPATTTVYSHPDTEPSSSTVSQPSSMNISCPALFSPKPNPRSISPHTPPGLPLPCSAPLTTEPSGSRTSPARTTSPAHLCQHTPRCVARQPKPPPPEKCSVLVHMGSKYHEHQQSHAVPARYGPHDDCMAVENVNYGCSDCIWYKKWGELHGYPDLYPWKYINSRTYSDEELQQPGN